MIRVAIVEDDEREADELKEHLNRFMQEKEESFRITEFRDGLDFLSGYSSKYDIIFMDIKMPGIDGMETASRLRKLDPKVSLVFVTNMAQYAIKGYEVEAMDFLLKPVSYYRLRALLLKIIRRMVG